MGVCHARFRVRRVYSSEYKESPLVQGEAAVIPTIDECLNSGHAPPLSQLRLRGPEYFSVGGLHVNVDARKSILVGHPCSERILDWLTTSRRWEFEQPFRGSFKGAFFGCSFCPSKSCML